MGGQVASQDSRGVCGEMQGAISALKISLFRWGEMHALGEQKRGVRAGENQARRQRRGEHGVSRATRCRVAMPASCRRWVLRGGEESGLVSEHGASLSVSKEWPSVVGRRKWLKTGENADQVPFWRKDSKQGPQVRRNGIRGMRIKHPYHQCITCTTGMRTMSAILEVHT